MMNRDHELALEMHRLLSAMGSDFCSLGLLDPESRVLTWKWAVGNVSERYRHIGDKPGRGFHLSVIKVGRAMPLQVADLLASRQVHEYPILLSEKLRSAYAVPLADGLRVTGVLLIGDRVKRIYRPEDRTLAAAAGEFLSALIRRPVMLPTEETTKDVQSF